MAAKNRFSDGTKYLVEGRTLNEIYRSIATGQILPGPGYDLSVVPGTGTTLRILAPAGPPRQWQIRVAEDIAEIRSGTLTGVGLAGFIAGRAADTWYAVGLDKALWLKVEIDVSGAPYTYSSSPETVETVYLPQSVDSAIATLVEWSLSATPTAVAPTIDPDTGEPATTGEYYFRIGSTASTGPVNDYIGPLAIGWCPPHSAYLTQLT